MNKRDVNKIIKALPSASFTNEYGEEFTVSSNSMVVFISGDEVDMMVDDDKKMGAYIPLFNNNFSIWSKDELYKLGKALMELHK